MHYDWFSLNFGVNILRKFNFDYCLKNRKYNNKYRGQTWKRRNLILLPASVSSSITCLVECVYLRRCCCCCCDFFYFIAILFIAFFVFVARQSSVRSAVAKDCACVCVCVRISCLVFVADCQINQERTREEKSTRLTREIINNKKLQEESEKRKTDGIVWLMHPMERSISAGGTTSCAAAAQSNSKDGKWSHVLPNLKFTHIFSYAGL